MVICIIVFIHGLCVGWSYGLIEKTNNCGLISVTEPAIDGRYVVFRFAPNNPREGEVEAVWRYTSSDWRRDYDVRNTSRHFFVSNSTTRIYTMYLKCDTIKDKDLSYWMQFKTTSGSECESEIIRISVIDAPTGCGKLYKRTEKITAGTDVMLEHYASDSELQDQQSVRLLKRINKDCHVTGGCPINSTLYEEEYQNFNDVTVYRIGNFTSALNGDYKVQCTDGNDHITATNVVTIVLPVPPQNLAFLNTTDIDGCQGCISGNYHSLGDVVCYVEDGTSPVTVTISIPSDNVEWTCDLSEGYNACKNNLRFWAEYHLKDIICQASNKATDEPLTTTTRLYTIREPTSPFLKAPRQYEGDVDVTCSSYGDQPTPELSFLINGSHVTNITEDHITQGKKIRLGYLRREWNGAKISCCMRHPYYSDPNCTTKTLSYHFSPESIHVTQLSSQTDDTINFVQTFQCAISNAHPACSAVWSYPAGAVVSVGTEETNVTTGLRGETTLASLSLNVTKEVNGDKVQCRAECEEFNGTNTWATYSMLVPYPPTISINTSTDVSLFEGESFMAMCQVDSLLATELSWVNGRNETLTRVDCGEDAVCIEVLQASVADAGIYSCIAETEIFETQRRTFELNIMSKSSGQQDQITGKPPIVWIVGGLAAGLVVILVVMVTVVVRKRRVRNGKIPDPANVNDDPARIETRPVGETSGEGTTLQDAPDNVYANTNDVSKAPIPEGNAVQNDVEYSAVIPKPKRKKKTATEASHRESTPETKELVYVDLDLEPSGATGNQPVNIVREPATEYVSIDFTRVGEPLPEEDTENIYVNQ